MTDPYPPSMPIETLLAPPSLPSPAPVSLSPAASPTPARRLRTWPAALALAFISPAIAELLSGSTPPLRFVQPFALIVLPSFYGVWAVLIHEIVVRRGLSWGNVLLMGAAFGIFQEALVVQTWFNFQAPGSPAHSNGSYGVAFGTAWNWGVNLTIYHAFISITAPLILVGLLFPRQAPLPWLGRKRIIALTIWMLLISGLLTIGVAFHQSGEPGYAGPPFVPYLVAAELTILAMLLGAFVRFPVPAPPRSKRHMPRPFTIALTIFGLITLFSLGTMAILPGSRLPAIFGAEVSAGIFAFALWRVRSWSARPGWSDRHWLALVTGVVLYFTLLWGPLVEFVARLPDQQGLVLADLLALSALLLVDQRLKRRAAHAAAALANLVPDA